MRDRARRSLFLFVAVGLILGLAAWRAIDPSAVQSLRESYFDQLQRQSPRDFAALPVRVVDIDEASLAVHGQWPWPRHMMADLTDRLMSMGAAVVVFDVIFAERDRLSAAQLLDDPLVARTVRGATWLSNLDELDYDRIFAATMDGWPVVLGTSDAGVSGPAPLAAKSGFVEVGPGSAALPRLRTATGLVPELYASAAGLGAINVSPSAGDGIIRNVPLVWRTESGFLPSLALEGLRIALGESTVLIMSDPSDQYVDAIRLGGYDIPTDQNGLFRVHYRTDDPALYVPAKDVLDRAAEGQVAPSIEGHIVFIGTSAAGLLDIRTTALGTQVPGVSIHAQIVEQILLETYLTRSLTQDGAEILTFAVLSLLVFLALWRFGPTASVVLGGLAGIGTLAASWLLYSNAGILFDATFPMVGGFIVFSTLTVVRFAVVDQEKRLIRKSFSKYVAPTILQEIEDKGHDLKLGGDMRDVSVMFADIRDFTPLSASMTPEELVALLNELFSDLTEEILDGRGTVDKYIGDSIMAFWNAPLEIEDKGHDLKLGGDMRDVSVMFADIRDFTPLSASMTPEELVALLNELFSDLTEEILDGRGTVDKYIGDSIMAFWNAPLEIEEHRRHACLTAVRMRERLHKFSETRTSGHTVRMATGLAAGMACVGNMGSRERFNYSVIGNVVNEAARIEAACRHVGYDILASSSVTPDDSGIAILSAGHLDLKGIDARVSTNIVVGGHDLEDTDAFQALAKAHQDLIGALESGGSAIAEVTKCLDLAPDVEKGLVGFYERITERREDFLLSAPPEWKTRRA